MALALDEPKENDHSQEFDGITYLLDKDLAEQIGAVSVDYVERGWRAGFVISTKNPLGSGIPECGGSCDC
jgi:Fe-S cluster assembly iron-binding protein IscA